MSGEQQSKKGSLSACPHLPCRVPCGGDKEGTCTRRSRPAGRHHGSVPRTMLLRAGPRASPPAPPHARLGPDSTPCPPDQEQMGCLEERQSCGPTAWPQGGRRDGAPRAWGGGRRPPCPSSSAGSGSGGASPRVLSPRLHPEGPLVLTPALTPP